MSEPAPGHRDVATEPAAGRARVGARHPDQDGAAVPGPSAEQGPGAPDPGAPRAAVGEGLEDPASPPGGSYGGGSRSRVFRGGIWNAASAVLPMGSTLALSIVISRLLGAEVLGEQSLVAYVSSLLVSVVIVSFTTASVRLIAAAGGAREEARLAHLARWSGWAHLAGGATSAAVLVAVGLGRDSYQALWFVAAATTVVDSLCWGSSSRHIARHGWGPTSVRRLVATGATPLLGIAAILLGAGITGVFVAQLVSASVLLVVLRRMDRASPYPSTRDLPAPAWPPVLRVWALFALSSLLTQVVDRRVELVFLDAYRSAEEVAHFSVAFNVVGIALVLSTALISAAMPAIAAAHGAGEVERVDQALGRVLRIVVTLALLLAGGAVSVAPLVVTAAWGPAFAESGDLVRWLSVTLLLSPLAALCSAYWTGTGRLRPVLAAGGAGATADVALAWLLVPPLGVDGAVVASVAGSGTAAAVLVVVTLRSGVHLGPAPVGVARAAATALAATAAALGADALVDGPLALVAALVAFLAVTALAGRAVGLFSREDTAWFADTVPGPARRALLAVSPARWREGA